MGGGARSPAGRSFFRRARGFPAGLFDQAAGGRPARADEWVGKRAGGRRMVVRNGRGRAGGFPATPSSTLGRPRTARSFKELFSLRSKAFESLAVLGAPACFPGSECGVTPLPQFPRPSRPQCLPQPAAAGVKFRCGARPPNVRRWGQRSAASYRGSFPNALLPAPPAGVPLGGAACARGPREGAYTCEAEKHTRGPSLSLHHKAENHTRGPRVRVPSWQSRMEPTTEARGLHPGSLRGSLHLRS